MNAIQRPRAHGAAIAPTSPADPEPLTPARPRPRARTSLRVKDPLLGAVLKGVFRLETRLSEGEMSSVYRGRDLRTDELVAVKVQMKHERCRGTCIGSGGRPCEEDCEPTGEITRGRLDHLRRFEREARVSAELRHPHIVSLLDVGQTSHGLHFMVMEFLDGDSLGEVLRRQGRLPAEQVALLGIQICHGLHAAHALGLVHRDLRPDNLVLHTTEGGGQHVKIIDFGLADLRRGRAEHTDPAAEREGTGLLDHLSPEQALARPTTPATDIYSLGTTLFELLSGHPPFSGTELVVALQHIHDPAPLLSVPGLAGARLRQWQELLGSMMAKDPLERPADALEVARRLAPLAAPPRRRLPAGTQPGQPQAGPLPEVMGGAVAASLGWLAALTVATVAGLGLGWLLSGLTG